MDRTRREGDYIAEQLPLKVRMEIQAVLFKYAAKVIIVCVLVLAFLVFIDVKFLPLLMSKDSDISISERLIGSIFFLFMPLMVLYSLLKHARTIIYFSQGRFTYRVARVIERYKKMGDEDSPSTYYFICEDEDLGYPELLKVPYREYDQTAEGGYVYVIYMDADCKIAERRIVYHTKARDIKDMAELQKKSQSSNRKG